jgi:peptidoglycan/LPS O-acetylase OafA/YrhL
MKSEQRIPALDLLRGFAALAVAVPHFFMFTRAQPSLIWETLSISAVEVFFVLSGFVLGYQILLCAERRDFATLSTFLMRRWMRTIPSYLFALLAVSALAHQLFSFDFLRYATYTQNLFFQANTLDYFPVAWSLSVEEWYYVVFPLLVIGTTFLLRRRLSACVIAALALILLVSAARLVFGDHSAGWGENVRRVVCYRIDSIAYGFLLFLVMHSRPSGVQRPTIRRPSVWIAGIALAITAAGLLELNHAMSEGSVVLRILNPFASAAFGVCAVWFFAVVGESQSPKSFVARQMLMSGRLSYPIYLLHLPVLLTIKATGLDLGLAGYLCIVLVASAAFHYQFERPILAARPSYLERRPLTSRRKQHDETVSCNFSHHLRSHLAARIAGQLRNDDDIPVPGVLMSTEPKRRSSFLVSALQTIAAIVVGIGLAEAAYRVRLLHYSDRIYVLTARQPEIAFTAVTKSPWVYDEDIGFNYAQERVDYVSIKGNSVECSVGPETNRDGVPGLAEGDYRSAQIKIAVFGDSFTVFAKDGIAWPNVLQRELSARTGKSVYAMNSGRDGQGLVQIMDVAAASAPALKPDIIILAYATGNMTTRRIWRQVTTIDGEPRILTTTEPGPPDLLRSMDARVLAPEATPEWCAARRADNATASRIIERYLKEREPEESFSALTLTHTFLLNRYLYNDPFKSAAHRSAARHFKYTPEEVSVDARLSRSLDILKRAGAQIMLLHTPYLPEIKSRSYPVTDVERAFLEAFLKKTGLKSETMLDTMPPVADPTTLADSADNLHPSRLGMDFYAKATADLLLQKFGAVFDRSRDQAPTGERN